jgi:hypothetical protein
MLCTAGNEHLANVSQFWQCCTNSSILFSINRILFAQNITNWDWTQALTFLSTVIFNKNNSLAMTSCFPHAHYLYLFLSSSIIFSYYISIFGECFYISVSLSFLTYSIINKKYIFLKLLLFYFRLMLPGMHALSNKTLHLDYFNFVLLTLLFFVSGLRLWSLMSVTRVFLCPSSYSFTSERCVNVQYADRLQCF